MRRLAAQIGYSPSAIYRHFKDKGEILDSLVEESFAVLVASSAKMVEIADEAPVDRLKRGMRAYVEFGLGNPDHYRFAFLQQSAGRAPTAAGRLAYEGLRGRIRTCVEAGYFPDNDLDLMAQSLWSAAHGVTSLLIQRQGFPWVAREVLVDQVIDSAVLGLAKKGSR